MLRRFQDSLESTGLVPPGARVLVGYSGGADSTCLLHLLVANGTDVVAAHLDHGQRSESAVEAQKCAEVAEGLGVPIVTGRADVPALARDEKIGLEEAGRRARYAFFESAMKSAGCQLTATAHTLDDQVETVLLNLTRGCGLNGLSGIPVRRDCIVRPLLAFSRAETRAYCLEHGLWFHDDPTNEDTAFARARMRLRVLPELEAVNPQVRQAVQRLASLVAEEDTFLDGMAAAALEQLERRLNGELWFLTKDCEVGLDLDGLLGLPGPLLRRALRLVAGVLGAQLDRESTDGLAHLMREPKGAWTFEGGTVVAEWADGLLHLRALDPGQPLPRQVPGTGEAVDPAFGWRLSACEGESADFRREPRSLDVVLDPGRLKGPLLARPAAPTDRMEPLGLGGTKSASDLFQSSGLTEAARRRLPVVFDTAGPVWFPGIEIAERVKMTENSSEGLRLSLEPLERGGP